MYPCGTGRKKATERFSHYLVTNYLCSINMGYLERKYHYHAEVRKRTVKWFIRFECIKWSQWDILGKILIKLKKIYRRHLREVIALQSTVRIIWLHTIQCNVT